MTRLAEVTLFLLVLAAGAVFVRLAFNLWLEIQAHRNRRRPFTGLDIVQGDKDGSLTGVTFKTYPKCPRQFSGSQFDAYVEAVRRMNGR